MRGEVLIAGGGTGGHLFPGLAVAGELKRLAPGLAVTMVGAGRALEERVFARAGFPAESLGARPLAGQGTLGRLKALATLPGTIVAALGLLRRHRAKLVLAVGGYAAFPLGLAAWLQRVPLMVQEQNAAPGLTNRALGRLARVVFTSFPGGERHFAARKVRLTGNPVRPELLAHAAGAAAARPAPGERCHLLVAGGSQGAHRLNRALLEALPGIAPWRERLFITHQTGPADQAEVERAYRDRGFSARVAAFFDEMGEPYGQAHLVLCRAGAGTLSELCAVGRAAILVPYPHAAGDHQALNARALVEAGAARLVKDAELTGERTAALLNELLADPAGLTAMEERALALSRPLAATAIAQALLDAIEERA